MPEAADTRADGPGGMPGALGMELLENEGDVARGRFEVTDRVRQPYGIVHGGAYATLSESVCSHATYAAVAPEGKRAFGMTNDTSFLRPVSEGTVTAEARVRHRGKTTWVWEVDFTDDEGRLCALSRLTIAVR